MDYLLDTHVLLWYIEGSSKLSKTSQEIIQNTELNKFISIASLWEIAIKTGKDKLILTQPFESLNEYISINEFKLLSIQFTHLSKLKDLIYYHSDPFDRLIIAQARTEGLSIISADRHFQSYPVKVIW